MRRSFLTVSLTVFTVSILVGCAPSTTPTTPNDAGTDGATSPIDADAGRDPRLPDDAAIDAWEPDVHAPEQASTTPPVGAAIWLHAPITITFDEPLAATSTASVTASISAAGGGASISATAAIQGDAIVVTLASGVRGVGALDVHVSGTVADSAGNSAPFAKDFTFVVPAWDASTFDRGLAATAPHLAMRGDGTTFAAWTVGGVGARRLVAGSLAATWSPIGGPLGATDATSPAVALDENGALLVAWIDAGVAHVARWTGAWTELASPGNGAYVALATPAGGAPICAVFGSTIVVRELVSDAWQSLGMDVAPPAPLAGEPVLATGSAGHAAIGWIDTAGNLRVYRYDAAWTAITPISVGGAVHLALAARGTTVAVAWDELAGSYGLLAAQVSGVATAWTRLGHSLDVDLAGDATAPAIAIDSSGAPIVAWTELVETAQRGVLARWSGSAWTIVGGVTWLGSSTTTPAAPHIALDAGNAAVISTVTGGAIKIARLNGPASPALGLAARASIAGCSLDVNNPPAAISQTGCFDLSTANHPGPHAGLVPYDVVVELWSDGAKKRRWIGLPDGQAMTLGATGTWAAPAGSVIVKEFALETTAGDPSTRRPIETRFLVNDASLGWQGFSYRWNAAGTDAALQPDTAVTAYWPMDDGSQHAHVYPSRAHCRSCHYTSSGPLLGLRPEQLQRWFDYGGVIAPQLPTLAAIGVGPASSAQPWIGSHEPNATPEQRMRGYMAANCSHCHNPQYISIKDLRYTTPLASTRLCEVITPGSPSGSVVYQKISTRPGMPPLGTAVVDPLAQDLLGSWITGMTSCP